MSHEFSLPSEPKLTRQQRREKERKNKKRNLRSDASSLIPNLHHINDDTLILASAKFQNILESQYEIDLWSAVSAPPSKQKKISPEQIGNAAMEIVNETLKLMGESENPFFKEAVKVYDDMLETKELKIHITKHIHRDPRVEANMGIAPEAFGDNLFFNLQVNPDYVLYNSNGMTRALTLVHEAEHIKLDKEIIDAMPDNLLKVQKLMKYDAMTDNPEFLLQIEAYTEAAAAEALIYQMGLGWNGALPSFYYERAAAFIRGGNNPESKEWLSYIRKRLGYLK